jgi:hypothetical protein
MGGYAPLVNPTNGQNNYAPLASPSFSGTVGIGQAAPASPTLVGMTGNVNGNTSLSALNNNTGTAAQALFSWSNGTNQLYVGIDGTNFVAPAGQGNAQGPNSSVMLSTAANGLYIGSLTAHGVTRFFSADASSNSLSEGYFDDTGWHLPTLAVTGTGANNGILLANTTTPSLFWGSATTPMATLAGYTPAELDLTAGGHWNGSAWVADATSAQIVQMASNGFAVFGNNGLTVGSTFSPARIATISATGSTSLPGIELDIGSLFIANQNMFQHGTWTPTLSCDTNPVLTTGSIIGNWWTAGNIVFFFGQVYWNSVTTPGAGNAFIGGLPFPAVGTGGGQGGMEQSGLTITNASVSGGNRILATIYNGDNYILLYETGSTGGDWLNRLPCANAWANTPSGMFINGWYAYQ